MSLNIPDTPQELIRRSKTDIQRETDNQVNPFKKNSLSGAIASSAANRAFDNYRIMALLAKFLMPDLAEGEFARRWANIYLPSINPATKASGEIIVGGVVGEPIPIGTTWVSSSGQTYESQSSVSITSETLLVDSVNRTGNVVTVVTTTPHGLATNIVFTLTGAGEPEYNVVDQEILEVLTDTSFTFEIDSTPSTPATGIMNVAFNRALVHVESNNFQDSTNGINVNLENGDQLNIQQPLNNIDSVAGVGLPEIGGGSDIESQAEQKTRYLKKIRNPAGNFSVSDIENKALEVSGVTRVFVREVTPTDGDVTIYFMRDNDSNPIPDAAEVQTVKDKILEIKPANTSSVSVIVSAPTPVVQNFTFVSFLPNTTSMKASVEKALQTYFEEETNVGFDITVDQYRSAIQNTIDEENGDRIQSFVLSSPSGTINVASNEIAVLGAVTFP